MRGPGCDKAATTAGVHSGMRGQGYDNAVTTTGVHSDMRGQGYDNAATTAGVHSGMRGQEYDNSATTAGVHSEMRGRGCDNAATTAGVHSDMRGQGCDNAATMAGVHCGVQRRILDINPLATYVPCNNHSLNLAGVHSAQESVNATTSFGRWIVSSCSSQHQPTDGMYSSNTSRERPFKGPGRPDGARDMMQSMRWRRVWSPLPLHWSNSAYR